MKYLAIILSSGAIAGLPLALHAADPVMCTMQYDPVCAVKNGEERTYGNSCTAGADGATFVHRGECGTTDGSVLLPTVPVSGDLSGSVNVGADTDAGGVAIDSETSLTIEQSTDVTTNEEASFPEPARERNIFVRAWVSISTWFASLF